MKIQHTKYSVTAKIGDGDPMIGLLQASGLRGWLRSTCDQVIDSVQDARLRAWYVVLAGKPNAASDHTDKRGDHAGWRDALISVVSRERQI